MLTPFLSQLPRQLILSVALTFCAAQAAAVNGEITANDVTLIVSSNKTLNASQTDTVRQWLDHLTASMLLVHSKQPYPALRIELEISPNSRTAVPFGQVIRRKTPGMRFFINPNLPLNRFIEDWTPYHEASHLFIPYPGQQDIWVSEGLASYYQNVLRYRAGVLSEREAWQKLLSGFKRASEDTANADLTLRELSAELRNRYAFMRVYWSGALYFLEADMLLRSRTNNRQSLDTALGEFAACCLRQNRRWTGREILARLDELTETNVFVTLYRDYAQSRAIPAFEPVLKRAGVEIRSGLVTTTSRPPAHDLGGIPGAPEARPKR